MAANTAQTPNLAALSTQELSQARNVTDSNLKVMIESYGQLKHVFKRLEDTKVLISNLKTKPSGVKTLVPLSNNLFIPGTIKNTNKFMLDIGTGYYVDADAEAALKHTEHDLAYVKENADKVGKQIEEKTKLREQINIELNLRILNEQQKQAAEKK